MMRIGIPRGMLYYDYYPLWKGFFTALGCEVIDSPPTNGSIAERGVKLTCDEACYPVKIFHGHVESLAREADCLFIPKMVSTQAGTYTCPKLIGLADMVKHSIPDLPLIIEPQVNLRLGVKGLWRTLNESARHVTRNPFYITRAYQRSLSEWRLWRRGLLTGRISGLLGDSVACASEARPIGSVAVVGHSYNLYDSHINMHLIPNIQAYGYRVFTPEMLSNEVFEQANRALQKPLFWSLGRKVWGAVWHYTQRPDIKGIIHVTSFGCGLESLVADMCERVAREKQKPFMLITLDEHTGEAGLKTRLEAFLDMLNWRGEAS